MSTPLERTPEHETHPPLAGGESCLALLSRRLRASPGVHAVEADFEAGTLTVRYEPDLVSPERIEVLAEEVGALFAQRVTACEQRVAPDACTRAAVYLTPFETRRWSPRSPRWRLIATPVACG